MFGYLRPRFVPFSLHFLDPVIGAHIEIGFCTLLYRLYIVFYIYTGKNQDRFDSIEGVEVRQVPTAQGSSFLHTFGTVDGGGELMRVAWPQMEHVFAVRRPGDTVLPSIPTKSSPATKEGDSPTPCPPVSSPEPTVYIGCPGLPKYLLNKKPVDLLVVERSSDSKCPPVGHIFPWERTVEQTKPDHRPKVVLECWKTSAITWTNGPFTKACLARWSQHGYESSLKLLHGLDVGSATNHHRLMIVRVAKDLMPLWNWPDSPRKTPHRSMSNLLTPPGLVQKHLYLKASSALASCAESDPMPIRPGARIRTTKGVRGLALDEFCRGLGYLKKESSQVTHQMAMRTTPLFHWEFLSPALSGCPAQDVKPREDPLPTYPTPIPETTPPADPSNFTWTPPNLQEGGKWFLERIANLKTACATYQNTAELVDDGLSRLNRHRLNYSATGPDPSWLQLLWWEFPREHWEDLRNGFRQNFLVPPPTTLTPNSDMSEAGLVAAGAFVDELLSLGAIRSTEDGMKMLANAPLFVVEKPGQPEQ